MLINKFAQSAHHAADVILFTCPANLASMIGLCHSTSGEWFVTGDKNGILFCRVA
ncbi:MAG TPA: hypothetical protein VK003_07065 [Oceanobacillus sp.]|nr:hypothetical protein [Oceanobacillus sp.]